MKNNINGFSKLSKEKKIDWIAANYFAEPEKSTQLIKSYWNADAKLQQTYCRQDLELLNSRYNMVLHILKMANPK